MNILTPYGVGETNAVTFATGAEPELTVTLQEPPKRQLHIPRSLAVPLSHYGLIRIANLPTAQGRAIGTLQFYNQRQKLRVVLMSPGAANESRIAISRVAGEGVELSEGLALHGTAIIRVWLDRWGTLEVQDDLSVEAAAERIVTAESGTVGVSVGYLATVAMDVPSKRLLYLGIWFRRGIVRFNFHDAFPE